jgi:hypothetical protein
MNITEFKTALGYIEHLKFMLPNGSKVPAHFHLTEIGKVDKHFVDCGGTERKEQIISMQLWTSIDYHHRLKPSKLQGIVEMAMDKLGIQEGEIEVEYQGDTIEKYALALQDGIFHLKSKQTDCLAKDACGIPGKVKTKLADLSTNCCSPESGCC